MADPGEGPSLPPPLPLFLDQTKAGRAKNFFGETGPPPISQGLDDRAPPLSEGLDAPLVYVEKFLQYLLSVTVLCWPRAFNVNLAIQGKNNQNYKG